MQKQPSAPTAQGRANRLLVQQKEEVKEGVKQQGRTTHSDCVHSSPNYLSLRRQAITLANPQMHFQPAYPTPPYLSWSPYVKDMKCKMRIHPSAVAEHYLSLILLIKIF
jgi:hypothetical protein